MEKSIEEVEISAAQSRGESRQARLAAWLARLPRSAIVALSLFAVALVAAFDYATPEIDIGLFYFGPVALATWFAGRRNGIYVSVMASVAQSGIDLATHPFSSYLVPASNLLTRMTLLLITTVLLAEVHRQLRVEQALARTDSVTGILNFRAFSQRLAYSIALARRDNRPLTLAYLDMDNFKAVNDRYGHDEGDRLLRAVGDTLTHFTRDSDSVARLGGDEFAVLLPNTGLAGAQEVLGKLREALFALRVRDEPIGCSVGAVTFEQAPSGAEEALRAADSLMYRVKHSGKKSVAFGRYDATTRAVQIVRPAAALQETAG